MRDNHLKYYNRRFGDSHFYRYGDRRRIRRCERDFQRLIG